MTQSNIILDSLAMTPTERRPVWIMRQAGRYMKSFRDLRAKHSFLEICDSADLIVQTTFLPLNAYALDAAIVFYDILMPLRSMGYSLQFGEDGPVIEGPRDAKDLDLFSGKDKAEKAHASLLEALKELRASIPAEKALLGFAGAPFTMLAYWLEGKLTKDLSITKTWLAKEPKRIHRCLDLLATYLAHYLETQVEAGADAVQLFDTWASVLSPQAYSEFALPYARKVLSHVTAPSLYYVNGVSGILDEVTNVGAQGLSIDWRMNLKEARARVSPVIALQGNLDPYDLHLPKAFLRQKVFDICDSYGRGAGHIFNLGHGIVPGVPEDSLKVVIDAAAEWSQASLRT